MTGARPRVLAALPGLFPSTVINVAKPLMRLVEAGAIDLDLTVHFAVRRRQIERADVLVMSHTIDPTHTWILDCARDAGIPLLYDIDENLLEPPADVPGLDFHRDPARQAAVRQALTQAALVRTYAPALQRRLQSFNPNVVRSDGPVDWRLLPDQPPPRPADRIRIVYATSRLREDSIGVLVAEPLRRVLDAHPQVDVTIWGPRLPALERHPRVEFREFIRDYDRYFATFARAGFDIGLAPMPGEVFYQSKTATKFREYAACRIAGIYADVEMYRDCVTDGDTGLLVRTADEWVAAMGRLIADEALRSRIQARAHAYARERYSAERIDGDWLTQIDRVRSAKASAERTTASRPPAHSSERSTGSRPSAMGAFVAAASRALALLRSAGLRAVWARASAQLADRRKLAEWELALRRLQRQHHDR